MIEFEPFPKIARLNRGMIITEKIDGTNGAIVIDEEGEVGAQSRNRLADPDFDNFGFAAWVHSNADALRDTLGVGRHFGEWWGKGILRNYGRQERRFSLFNTTRWNFFDITDAGIEGLSVVPEIHVGPFDQGVIDSTVRELRENGSICAPGFMRPEGIVIYLPAAAQAFKVTCEKDELPKGVLV